MKAIEGYGIPEALEHAVDDNSRWHYPSCLRYTNSRTGTKDRLETNKI